MRLLRVAGRAFMDFEMSVEGKLAENVLKKVEDEFSERISLSTADKISPSSMLNRTNIEEERESIKKEIMKALFVSNSTQRIYFVVRSLMMTILGALITLAVFWELRTIDIIEDFVLGVSLYAISLILSRLFDTKIVNISKNILAYLGEHPKLRDFILRNM
jgi:hypothetical protein